MILDRKSVPNCITQLQSRLRPRLSLPPCTSPRCLHQEAAPSQWSLSFRQRSAKLVSEAQHALGQLPLTNLHRSAHKAVLHSPRMDGPTHDWPRQAKISGNTGPAENLALGALSQCKPSMHRFREPDRGVGTGRRNRHHALPHLHLTRRLIAGVRLYCEHIAIEPAVTFYGTIYPRFFFVSFGTSVTPKLPDAHVCSHVPSHSATLHVNLRACILQILRSLWSAKFHCQRRF